MVSNGSSVNPAFISGFNNLRTAKTRYEAAKVTGNNEQIRAAEQNFHRAENLFCNQKGIIAGGTMTENQAISAVDGMMNQVHSWYA